MSSQNQKSEVVVALPADEWARIVKCISDWLMGRGIDPSGRFYVFPGQVDRTVGELRFERIAEDRAVGELRFERIAEDRARCVQIPSLVVIAK